MQRADSTLIRNITQGTQHQHAALHPDEGETIYQIWEQRPSEDATSAHNTPSDRDPSRVTPMWSETSFKPAQVENMAENDTNVERPKPEKIPSTELHRSGYTLFLVLVYIDLAIFASAVTCSLSFRPITTASHGPLIGNGSYVYHEFAWYTISLYNKNQKWYQAARVIQAIVSVLTIPLTSAVCSSAAVVFVQKKTSHGGLSMRQVITIADKGWTDIPTNIRTFPFFCHERLEAVWQLISAVRPSSSR